MTTFRLGLKRGQTVSGLAIAAGTAEAQSDTMSLNIDTTRMTKGEALIALEAMKQGLFKSPWPPAGGAPTPTPKPTLNNLTLSVPLTHGVVTTGDILGATPGATITSSVVGLVVNSAARTFAFNGNAAATTYDEALVETLSEATNSPRTSPISVAAAGGTLEPNPVPAPGTIAGPVGSLAFDNAGNARCYIKTTVTHDGGIDLFAGGLADGSGEGYRLLNGNRFAVIRRHADGSTELGFPSFGAFPSELPSYADFPTDVYTEIGADGFKRLIVDNVLIHEQDINQYLDNGNFGNYVGIDGSFGAAYTDISYGVVGSGAPLRIASQTLAGDYRPQARLIYSGSPDTYEVRIRSAGGAVLRDWVDGVITDPIKGACTVTAPAGIPATEFGSSPQVDYRQKNLPSATQTKSIAMPAGKAKIGMNLTPPIHYGGERIFKNLAYANDGWRSGSSYLNPTSNPTLFDANGNMIASGGFQPRQAFGRCNVAGSRCRVEWEGGDNPLTDMELAGGEGVGYANIVRGSRWIEFDYNFSWDNSAFGYIEQKGFYPSNPIIADSIRISEVGTNWNNGVFDDAFIARASVYDYARLMDWMGSNSVNYIPPSQPWSVEWADRTLPGKKLGYTGFPIEYCIEFANRSGCDIWTMLPAASSPDYDRRVTRAFFYGEGMLAYSGIAAGRALDAGRTVLKEKANEWFNSAFGIWHSAAACAKANGRASSGDGNNEARLSEQAYRLKTCWAAIDGHYPAGRLKKMVMGNPDDTYDGENLVARGADAFDIYGCAYYTMNVKFEDQPNIWPGQDKQALFDFASATIAPQVQRLKNHRNWAATIGKGFWVYEGNPSHWLEPHGTQPYADQAFFVGFQQDALMEPLTTQWFNGFLPNFDGGLTCYAAYGAPSVIYGSWGFTVNQGDTTLAKSPKQRALLTAVASLNA